MPTTKKPKILVVTVSAFAEAPTLIQLADAGLYDQIKSAVNPNGTVTISAYPKTAEKKVKTTDAKPVKKWRRPNADDELA